MENNKEKVNNNQNAVAYLRKNLPEIDKPIFIELIGTPKSGKTTLVNAISSLFEKYKIPTFIRRETAEYNPIQDKNSEEYTMWMIMELIKNLSEDLNDRKGSLVIYDRGLLDRIPWLEYGVKNGSVSKNDSERIKQLYEMDLLKRYKPLAYGFKTSPELSIKRKGGEGRLVNKSSLILFNDLLDKHHKFIADHSFKYNVTETDPYQERLSEFIMHITGGIIQDSCEVVNEILRQEIL